MKVAFYTKEGRSDATNHVAVLSNSFSKLGWEIVTDNPDLVIVIGGDGTFLKAVQHYSAIIDKVTFVGLGVGEFSYLYDFKSGDTTTLYQALRDEILTPVTYPLLEGKINNKKYFAFNDFRIISDSRVINLALVINGEQLELITANGMCVTTPQGSTGFTKSNHGAVLTPEVNGIEITEINPITNKVSTSFNNPLIVPNSASIDIIVKGSFKFCYDCLETNIENGVSLSIHKSKKTVKVLRPKDTSFIGTLREGFVK